MKFRAMLAAVTAVAGGLAGGLTAPAQATDDTIDYVAMGDSYSAGSGVLPLSPGAFLLCAQSSRNYPHVMAAALGASLTDVTCGGANTSHYSTSQYPGVAPQLDALSADTDLVTMTIGGNDTNLFAESILTCAGLGLATLGQGSPCKDAVGDGFDQRIDGQIQPNVTKALNDVMAKAPNAEVVILGTPWILPATNGCFLKMPIAKGDVPFLRTMQARLNGAFEKAAADTGATYVDLSVVSDGHDACKPIGTRWVEPALFGTNFVPVHPNALGEAKMAEAALAAIS